MPTVLVVEDETLAVIKANGVAVPAVKAATTTMCTLPRSEHGYDSRYGGNPLNAQYQVNSSGGSRNTQRAELLPAGFTFDPGWPRISRPCEGFSLRYDEQNRALAEWERRKNVALPDQEPGNPDRRRDRIITHSATAPRRRTEQRTRSVAVNREEVREEAKQYLQQRYTNEDAELICQICKDVLPFRLSDESFYFEAVELLPELTRHYDQNYLCLCPNHAAMFKHANGSRDTLKDRLRDQTENELNVVLARRDEVIYFNRTHLADLGAIIDADENSEDNESSESVSAAGR
jgi:hypothetical protein